MSPEHAAFVQRLEPGMPYIPGVDPAFPFGVMVQQPRTGRYFVLESKAFFALPSSVLRGASRTSGHPVIRRCGYHWTERSAKVAAFRLWYEKRRAEQRALRLAGRKK